MQRHIPTSMDPVSVARIDARLAGSMHQEPGEFAERSPSPVDNLVLRNIMAALGNAQAYPLHIQRGIFQSHVDQSHPEALPFGKPHKLSIFWGGENSFHPDRLVSENGGAQPGFDAAHGLEIGLNWR